MRRSDVFTVSGPGAFYNLLLNMNKSPDEKTPERMKQKKKKLLNSFLDKDEKKMSYNRCVRSNSHTHTHWGTTNDSAAWDVAIIRSRADFVSHLNATARRPLQEARHDLIIHPHTLLGRTVCRLIDSSCSAWRTAFVIQVCSHVLIWKNVACSGRYMYD